jgi:hypothetical protein
MEKIRGHLRGPGRSAQVAGGGDTHAVTAAWCGRVTGIDIRRLASWLTRPTTSPQSQELCAWRQNHEADTSFALPGNEALA